MQYRFRQFQDPMSDRWEVYGNFPSHMIRAKHTRKKERINIVDTFNQRGYQRDIPDELDIMTAMHSAYLDGKPKRLRKAAVKAAATYPGLQDSSEIYLDAASLM